MKDLERLQMQRLLDQAIQDGGHWKILSTGSTQEILALTQSAEPERTISEEVVEEFVNQRMKCLEVLRNSIEGQSDEQRNDMVEMFRKGIRVMDHTDPTYYGIR